MQPPSPQVRSVAVIGAGISGVAAAKYLSDAHLSVTVFERASSLGGIWVYDDRRPPEPPYPNAVPSSAEATPSQFDRLADDSRFTDEKSIAALQSQHAPPGPAYVSLKNNIPTCLMSFRDQDWPDGTPDYTHHPVVLDYVRAFAKKHDVERFIKFNTRVSRVVKQTNGWSVDVCTLRAQSGRVKTTLQNHHFDAIVSCIGHNSAPRVPDIRGLANLKQRWPKHITHSKSYRRSEDILGQNIVLIGNGASAYDIAHELKDRANNLYQVTKVNSGYIPLEFMPTIVERVAEVDFIEETKEPNGINAHLADGKEAPSMRVHLVDGKTLEDIHSIVLCTGYMRSYPFLAQYHDDHATRDTADDTVLVTDGSMLHNLHRDIFYIPQPTLAFVGVSTGTTSLAVHEYQSIAIAAFLSGQAQLPSEAEMRAEYQSRLEKKGRGRGFHQIMRDEVEYAQEIADWVNGGTRDSALQGYSQRWLDTYEKRKAWLKEVFSKRDNPEAMKAEGKNPPGICSENSAGYI